MQNSRDLWIDQPYAEPTWRVREHTDDGIVTLETFPTREQAQIFLEETLDPSLKAKREAARQARIEEQQKKRESKPRPTWTRGVSP